MNSDQGPITLLIHRNQRKKVRVEEILRIADKRVGEPGPPTLKLIGYIDGGCIANVALIEYTEPGTRMQYVNAFATIDGVDAAG